jgi:hypothetical protein
MTRQRSERVRAGIRRAVPLAIKLHGLNARGLATWVQSRILKHEPATFGLDRVPDIETISSVIRELRIDWQPVAALKPEAIALKPGQVRHVLAHSSSVHTT